MSAGAALRPSFEPDSGEETSVRGCDWSVDVVLSGGTCRCSICEKDRSLARAAIYLSLGILCYAQVFSSFTVENSILAEIAKRKNP